MLDYNMYTNILRLDYNCGRFSMSVCGATLRDSYNRINIFRGVLA